VWVAFASTAFTSGGAQYGFGIFVKPLTEEFGWSRTEINLSLSIGLISGLLSPLIGMTLDRLGSRLVMTASLATIALAFFLRAAMTELWQWYALSALLAIGMPGAFMPVGKLIGAWFPRTRGRMMGTAITGNNVFGLIGVPLLNLVVVSQGWRLGYSIIGACVAGTAAAAWLVLRDSPPATNRVGAAPDRTAPLSAASVNTTPPQTPSEPDVTIGEAARTRAFWLIMAGLTCAGFSYPSVMTQLIPHMEAEGWASSRATLALTALAGVALASKITWGRLSERLTARVSFVVAILIMSSGVVFLILAGDTVFVWPAIIYFGMGFGGIGPLMTLVILETFGLRNFGSIQGAISLVTQIVPVLIGPIMAGFLFDSTGSYDASFAIAAAIFATGAVSVFWARRPAVVRVHPAT